MMSTHIEGKNQNYGDELSSVLMPAEKQQDFDWQHIDLKKRGKIGGGVGGGAGFSGFTERLDWSQKKKYSCLL